MKTSTIYRFCVPYIRPALTATARAHTPVRYPTGAARASAPMPPLCEDDGHVHKRRARRAHSDRPQVLHVDMDAGTATALSSLLVPEAEVTHVTTLADARRLLQTDVFSLVVLDPALPDGDARTLLPLLSGTPLLVYSANQPDWRGASPAYLPKPWTSARQLWTAISGMLGIPSGISAGD
jgi:two-component system phosphate regulon response regulator OmpR